MTNTLNRSSSLSHVQGFKFTPELLVKPSAGKMQTAMAVPEATNDDFVSADGYAEFMASLESSYPAWFDELAQAEASFADREEMARLMVTAPHPFLVGMLYGKLLMKMEIAAITGRRLT